MYTTKDHTGKFLTVKTPPQRIISIVPSITELLADLNLDERVVGITKFCVHPNHWFTQKPRMGGTKNVNISKIQQLQPDLIIANKEENVREQIEELEKISPVFTTIVDSVAAAVKMIRDVGNLTDKSKKANEIAQSILASFDNISIQSHKMALYLIWKDPYMAAGVDTFISDMMRYAGYKNVLYNMKRYPVLTEHQIKELKPEVIFLSSEPYPFKEKHIQELSTICPDATIKLVDGEMFSWYGSRMVYSSQYFKSINKDLN